MPDASATTCYGPVIQGFGSHLMGRQHLPVVRTAELLESFLEATCVALRHAPVVHFDETGARVEGRLAWVHVACTNTLTLLYLAPGRSVESIGAGGILDHGFKASRCKAGFSPTADTRRNTGRAMFIASEKLAGIVESGRQVSAQQKISGTSRSRGGVEALLAVRSYVCSALKQGKTCSMPRVSRSPEILG